MAKTDRVLRQFCQTHPHRIVAFVRHVLGLAIGEVLPFSAKDARLEPPPLEADFIAFEEPGGVLHLEIQGYGDRRFPDRLWGYHLNAALRFGDRVARSVAVWLRVPPSAQRARRIRRGGIEIEVDHIVVPKLDAADLISAGLAFLASASDPGELTVHELCERVARALVESNASVEEVAVALVAAACHRRYTAMKAAMTRAGISEPIILEDFVEIGFDMGVERGIEQGRVEGIEQGRVEGIEQGRVEGIEQGRVEGLRTAVFTLADILELPIDADKRAEIEAMDHAQLTALVDRLRRLRSFD